MRIVQIPQPTLQGIDELDSRFPALREPNSRHRVKRYEAVVRDLWDHDARDVHWVEEVKQRVGLAGERVRVCVWVPRQAGLRVQHRLGIEFGLIEDALGGMR